VPQRATTGFILRPDDLDDSGLFKLMVFPDASRASIFQEALHVFCEGDSIVQLGEGRDQWKGVAEGVPGFRELGQMILPSLTQRSCISLMARAARASSA